MNYLQIFAKGGKIDTKAIKSEIARIFMLEDSPEKVEQLWQDAVNTYGSEEGVLSEIFKQVGENPSDESVQQAMMNVLNYTPMEESQMFKCGGKLQQLVTKFGKGGGVDCGCGGIKLDNGGKTISSDGSITIVNPNTAQADTLGRYSYPSTNGEFQLLSNGERRATVWDNTGGMPIVKYANETFIQNHPVRSFLGGYKPAPTGYFENLVDRVNNRFDKNGVPVKQEGGIVYTEMPGQTVENVTLNRRQARQLAKQNKGFNDSQFSYAMANAMNAANRMGLSGEEARQKALQMVSGITPMERKVTIADKPVDINTYDFNKDKKLPTGFGTVAPIQDLTPRPEKTIVPKRSAKRGIVEVGPLTDGYQDFANLRSSEAAKETIARIGYEKARRDELTASRAGQFLTEDNSQFDITGQPVLNWRGTRGTHNYTFNNNSNQPASITPEEINNSGYYRSSPEEVTRRNQRWNEYWNKPVIRPQYQTIDETYEATPGYSTGSGISFGQLLKNFLTRGATGYSGGAGYSKN